MARHTLMSGIKAAISATARVAVIADKLTEAGEVSVDNWLSELAAERKALADQIAAAKPAEPTTPPEPAQP